jgi:hypothetical protein
MRCARLHFRQTHGSRLALFSKLSSSLQRAVIAEPSKIPVSAPGDTPSRCALLCASIVFLEGIVFDDGDAQAARLIVKRKVAGAKRVVSKLEICACDAGA